MTVSLLPVFSSKTFKRIKRLPGVPAKYNQHKTEYKKEMRSSQSGQTNSFVAD